MTTRLKTQAIKDVEIIYFLGPYILPESLKPLFKLRYQSITVKLVFFLYIFLMTPIIPCTSDDLWGLLIPKGHQPIKDRK
jgi:hypothetical protein